MKFTQSWKGRNCREGDMWLSATVPGNIQYDYGVAHNFDDVQHADNHLRFVALENDAWEYVTHLKYHRHEGERVYFVTEGISYQYDIYLNDALIYSYEGMFRPVELDLTDGLTGGDDVLRVYIYPHPKRKDAKPGTRDEADQSCNPPVYYGWDWNPRLLISGLWEEAYIETRDEAYIGGCEVLADLSDDMKTGTVTYTFDCAIPCETLLYDENGTVVYRGTERTITVDAPALWWCNGQGEPTLYRWEIRNEREVREGYIGFRKLRLVRNADANGPTDFPKSRYEAPITIELNGRRIMGKGSNWVNPELFWGHITAERYDALLTLARDCHMNILRMWGGAGICKKAFYDICDRYGILVWQEFMLACNNYRATEHYMKVLESEATAIIKKLRAHPSLALWCGGNELFNSWSGMDDQSHALRLLNKLCYEYDYKRPFLATSPLEGMAHGGYTFYDTRQGGEVFNEFRRSHNTAYTEFGVPSLASAETLREIIPADELFPPRKTPAWVAHHGFDAWGENRWLCLDILKSYFGDADSIEELVAQSTWLQCEGYRAAFEEMRRQWPHCSMSINWCYNEPWKTAAGNNLIAYPHKPKPAYEYVKAAMRPTLFSARVDKFRWQEGETFAAELWLLNDLPEKVEGAVHVSLELGGVTYDLLDWSGEASANSNLQGPTVRMVLPTSDAGELTLILSAENGKESRYRLQYTHKSRKAAPKVLNM